MLYRIGQTLVCFVVSDGAVASTLQSVACFSRGLWRAADVVSNGEVGLFGKMVYYILWGSSPEG
jgi:hypothetical protein